MKHAFNNARCQLDHVQCGYHIYKRQLAPSAGLNDQCGPQCEENAAQAYIFSVPEQLEVLLLIAIDKFEHYNL